MRFFVLICVVVLAGVFMAPALLTFSQQVEKVDCVVMMVGYSTVTGDVSKVLNS